MTNDPMGSLEDTTMKQALRMVTVTAVLCAAGVAMGGEPAVPTELAENLAAGKKQTILTYGTSLTAGGAWVGQLGQALKARYGDKAPVINSGQGAPQRGRLRRGDHAGDLESGIRRRTAPAEEGREMMPCRRTLAVSVAG